MRLDLEERLHRMMSTQAADFELVTCITYERKDVFID